MFCGVPNAERRRPAVAGRAASRVGNALVDRGAAVRAGRLTAAARGARRLARRGTRAVTSRNVRETRHRQH